MAAVGHVDTCILSVLAHIAALDLGYGVIWGKEFISDVSFMLSMLSAIKWLLLLSSWIYQLPLTV